MHHLPHRRLNPPTIPLTRARSATLRRAYMVANALMGRYAQQVTFLTPFIVLVGSGGGDDAVGVALDRVVATLVGAVLAALIALALWRVDRRRQQT